jgi:hypothetical protein
MPSLFCTYSIKSHNLSSNTPISTLGTLHSTCPFIDMLSYLVIVTARQITYMFHVTIYFYSGPLLLPSNTNTTPTTSKSHCSCHPPPPRPHTELGRPTPFSSPFKTLGIPTPRSFTSSGSSPIFTYSTKMLLSTTPDTPHHHLPDHPRAQTWHRPLQDFP